MTPNWRDCGCEAQKAGEAEGYEKGYARGQTEGHAAGLAAAQAQAAQLHALTLALPAALRCAQASVADDLLALALDIARQVLGQALTAEPLAILAVVHELLQAEPALSGAPQLLLHPDDAALVQGASGRRPEGCRLAPARRCPHHARRLPGAGRQRRKGRHPGNPLGTGGGRAGPQRRRRQPPVEPGPA